MKEGSPTFIKKKTGFLIITVLLLGVVIYLSQTMLAPFLVAFFLAYAINPLVEFLERKGARREYAIVTVYIGLAIVAAVFFGLVIPRLLNDLTRALQKIPVLVDEFHKIERAVNRILSHWEMWPQWKFLTSEVTRRSELWLRRFMIDLAESAVNLFSQTLYFILVPLISYYISRDYPRMKRTTHHWLEKHFGEHWTQTFLEIDAVFRLYIRGQLLVTLIVGLLISIGLVLMGFEIAFFLGMLAGIFNLIPYFGPVMGAIPVIVFALLKSPWHVVYVILLFFGVNQLEVMYLAPKIIGGSLGLHPLVVIYLVLAGGKVFGLWGMIFAVPLGALILIIFKSIYEIAFGLVNTGQIPGKPDFNDGEPD
ncbi:MAG TPA: AI-2E family transporter [Bacillota bacterium]|nr:AI-2E family transporter [Bacillota bacterium]